MKQIGSYLQGSWKPGTGKESTLENPATGQALASVKAAEGLKEALEYGRQVGGASLRALTFAERGERLQGMARAIHGAREELIQIAIDNGGNTRGDAKFDIDGATAVLAAYAELAKSLAEKGGDNPWIVEDEANPLFRGAKIRGQHISLPRRGVAIQINAFNFPAWGMMGKAAVALLAGMPVLTKPATSSALLAHRITEILVEEKLFPEGSFQFLAGPAGDLLDHVQAQDVIAFTGSATTGAKIRSHAQVIAQNVRVNIEADSLNAALIGPDVTSGTELWDRILSDCSIELTQKAGQKCTATRRIFVPASLLEEFKPALIERLDEMAGQLGNPNEKGVRMGPLANANQVRDAREGIQKLQSDADIVRGNPERQDFIGVENGQGCFIEPILLQAKEGRGDAGDAAFHQLEVFGPVATLIPYEGSLEQAAKLVALGEGSLVTTLYTDDRDFARQAVTNCAPYLGRMVLVSEKSAPASLAPGCVFPGTNHGGPGRAGGGQELGGLGGMTLYMQRTALQMHGSELARLVGK